MRKIFYFFATLAFLAIGMVSCDKDEDNNNGGGDGNPGLVTGEYLVDTVTDVASGTEGTSTFSVSQKDDNTYLLEELLGVSGLPMISTYSSEDGVLMSDGQMEYMGKLQQVTGYWYGFSDSESGEVTQAILLASFISQDGGMMQPIIINTDKETGELTDFGSNLYLLVCPAYLDDAGMLQVDPNSGKVKCGITIGSKVTKVAATTSLSNVFRAPIVLAPVAPVRAENIVF